MPVEAATKISELNELWPLGTDTKSQGDDHIRLIKAVLKAIDGGALTNMVRSVKTVSGTYTKPVGLKFLDVEGVAPGGGSGSAAITNATQTSGSGGGGAGAWGKRLFAASELAATTAYTIGAAGQGGTAPNSGTNGVTSQFGSTFNCTLGGGLGSARVVGGTSAPARADGGAGGAVGAGWTVGAEGETGATTILFWSAGLVELGRGGHNPVYGTSQPTVLVSSGAGSNSNGYGAGGRGAAHNNSVATGKSGADGRPGMFIFTEYF